MSFCLEIRIGLFPGVCGCVILLPFPSSLCAGEYIQGIYYQGRVSQKLEYMLDIWNVVP